MKPLEALLNTEKAALLFQLFPAEIPEFLKFVEAMNLTITEDEQGQRERWQDGILSFDFWLSLVRRVQQVMAKYGSRLSSDHRLFSQQLFDGHLAAYLTHCLISYTSIRRHGNERFAVAIQLLFNS